jgi:hypothetical protein
MTIRVRLERDVTVVGETNDGLVLEGARRLRPGQVVELVRDAQPAAGRSARVLTWKVAQVGSAGMTYRGHCRWLEEPGNALPGQALTETSRARP